MMLCLEWVRLQRQREGEGPLQGRVVCLESPRGGRGVVGSVLPSRPAPPREGESPEGQADPSGF